MISGVTIGEKNNEENHEILPTITVLTVLHVMRSPQEGVSYRFRVHTCIQPYTLTVGNAGGILTVHLHSQIVLCVLPELPAVMLL